MKIIKIGAEWCADCVIMRPRWQEIEEELPWLETEYFDFDNDQEKLAEAGLEIQSDEHIPIFIFLDKNQKEVKRLHGEVSKDKLLETIIDLKAAEEEGVEP